MNNNIFDYSKCSRCNMCIQICPLYLIISDKENQYPGIPEDKAVNCIKCGHCEAVCPEGAIKVDDPLLQSMEVQPMDHGITAEQLTAYFKSRRSIRTFRKETVNKDTFDKLLDVVRYAPSGINRQPVSWVVVYNPELISELSEMVINWMKQMIRENSPIASSLNFTGLYKTWRSGSDPICRRAPHIVVACGRKEDRMAATDATIALAHLELAAPAFGVGACWAGYLNIAAGMSPQIREFLGIASDFVNLGTLMIGYPQYKYHRIPKRNRIKVIWK